jgi:hypothetical protein
MVALYSCSMQAAFETDADGRVVRISAVRFESSLRQLAVAMLVAGGHVELELRWLWPWSGNSGSRVDAGPNSAGPRSC